MLHFFGRGGDGVSVTLAPVSFSIILSVFPRGPMSSPTKLISGWRSCGIITLSETFTAVGLKK